MDELNRLLERSLEIGLDAVMRGEVTTTPKQTPEIRDFVQIATVDLSAYDRLCRACKEAVV